MRILERLEELAALGDRVGYSPEEDAAHELAAGWFRKAGLEVEVDAAGNLIGRIPGGMRQVWTGSHLDTVPGAGRFDGDARRRRRASKRSRRSACRGSASSSSGTRSGAAPAAGRAWPPAFVPDAYVELHIEQGPTLLRADAPLGVVTAIVGYVRGRRSFTGTAGHAGTTPMDGREDALVAAAEFVLRAREVAERDRGRRRDGRAGSRSSPAARTSSPASSA